MGRLYGWRRPAPRTARGSDRHVPGQPVGRRRRPARRARARARTVRSDGPPRGGARGRCRPARRPLPPRPGRPRRRAAGGSDRGSRRPGDRCPSRAIQPASVEPLAIRIAVESPAGLPSQRQRRRSALPGAATGAAGPAGRGPPRWPVEAANVTSIPVRSINSNGPSGKPAARIAASIASTVREPAFEQAQGAEREGPVDPVDDEARRVGRSDRGLAPASDEIGGASRRRPGPWRGPATTSTRRMSGAGLKKWSPTTRSGRLVAAAIGATDSALVFVARIVAGSATASSVRKIACFSVERLEGRLDDDVGLVAELLEDRRSCGGARCAEPIHSSTLAVSRPRPWRPRRAGRRAIRSRPRARAACVDVVEHDLVARPRARAGRSRRPSTPRRRSRSMRQPDGVDGGADGSVTARVGPRPGAASPPRQIGLNASNGWRHARQ